MTGKDVALDGDGALSAAQVSEQIQRLRQARDYVRSCSEGDAMDAKRNAELVREWVRIQKAAASIALEACKLQFVALRRLGQLEFLPGRLRFVAPGQTSTGPNERPPFGCCLLIWDGPHPDLPVIAKAADPQQALFGGEVA